MKRILTYFLQGLIYIAPIAITMYIIYGIFKVIDSPVQNLLFKLIGFKIPGLGIILMFVFITLLGVFGSTILATPFKRLFHQMLERAPLVKLLYSALNDLFSAFAGKDRKFNKPVLVKVNQVSDLHKMGFITEDDLSKINLEGFVAVYFPHSYNFSGEMFIVPANQVTPVDLPSTDVMKFVVSGGVAGWSEKGQ